MCHWKEPPTAYSWNSQTCLSSVCIPAKHHASGSYSSCFPRLPELRNYPKWFSFSPPLRPLQPTYISLTEPPNYNLTGGKMFLNLHLAFSPPATHTWLFLLTEFSPLSRQEDRGLQTWWKSLSPHCKSHFPSLPFTLSLLNLDLEFQSTVETSILVCNLKSFKYKINFGRLLSEWTLRPLNTWKRTWLSECSDEMRGKKIKMRTLITATVWL